jgi:hypothetical protein
VYNYEISKSENIFVRADYFNILPWVLHFIHPIKYDSQKGYNPKYGCLTLCDKFVSDLWQVGGFLWVLRFPPPIKLTATMKLKYCWKWR